MNRKRNHRSRPHILLAATALTVLVGGFGLAGCGGKDDGKGSAANKKVPTVAVEAVRKEPISRLLELTGETVAVESVVISAMVEGPISYCPWREGDRVDVVPDKPTRLIEINRELYRAEVNAAEAALEVAKAKLADLKAGSRPEEIAQAKESVRQLEECTSFAKADMDRIDSLVKSGSLPGESVEKARVNYVTCQTKLVAAKERLTMLKAGPTVTAVAVQEALVDEAQAKLATAKAKLSECIIVAPFAGIVTKVHVRPGDLATVRAPLLEMLDPSSLVVRFAVPETRAAEVRQGAEAVVRLDAHPGKTFRAGIERVYPELQRDTRTRMAEAKIVDPIELVPGLFARVSVVVRAADDAVVIPDKAILTTAQGPRVVYVVNDGKADMRKVTVGLEQGRRVQVTDGVRAGEMVVIAGHEGLKDGAQVQLAKAPPAATTKKASGGNGQ